MMTEARRSHRRNVHESVTVLDTMTEQVLGRIGNISESGMLMVASGSLLEDALYQLRFEIIDRTGRMVAIDVGAHVVWMGSANTPGQSWAEFMLVMDATPLGIAGIVQSAVAR